MRRVETAGEMRALSRERRARGGGPIGFVPTMGYLHEGHLALMRAMRAECDLAVASIFVNPAQFGPGMDLDRYPRDPEGDARKLAAAGVDVLFAPDAAAMYPPGYATWVEVEGLTARMDGASRPGYFRGICTVVTKLFHAVEPDVAWFGQKDVQQALVLRRMARDLDLAIDVRIEPTVRAADGLALSSRNAYLGEEQRALAPALYRALSGARDAWRRGERDAGALVARARAELARRPELAIDYVELVAIATLQPIERVDEPAVLAAAVVLDGTRLIDNVLLVADEAAALRGS